MTTKPTTPRYSPEQLRENAMLAERVGSADFAAMLRQAARDAHNLGAVRDLLMICRETGGPHATISAENVLAIMDQLEAEAR